MTEEPEAVEKLYQVVFDLPEELAAWAQASAERLWVAKTESKMEVQLRNTPFYVKGLAFGDVVRVRADHERRELVFEEFVSESGHSTVRVIVKEAGAVPGLSDLLLAFGCSWEIDSSGLLWAVDVPPKVEYESLRGGLLGLSDRGQVRIEEGALATDHRDAVGLGDSE